MNFDNECLAIVPFKPTAGTVEPAPPLALVPFAPLVAIDWAPLPLLDELAEFLVDEDADTQRSFEDTPTPKLQRQPSQLTPSPPPWTFWGPSRASSKDFASEATPGDDARTTASDEAATTPPLNARSVRRGVRSQNIGPPTPTRPCSRPAPKATAKVGGAHTIRSCVSPRN